MARAQFEKLVTTNARETSRLLGGKGGAGGDKEFGAELALYTAKQAAVGFPPHLYDKVKHPETAEFDEKWLKHYYDKYKSKKSVSASGYRAAKFEKGIYVFYWIAKLGSGTAGQSFVEGARRFVGTLYEKQGTKRTVESQAAQGDAFLVGGHVEASALLGKLRKGIAFGLITEEEAKAFLAKYRTGGITDVAADSGKGSQDRYGARPTTSKGGLLEGGFVNTEYSQEAFKVSDEILKNVSEFDTEYNVYHEFMIPIPTGLNKQQASDFENDAIDTAEAWLLNIADEKLYNDPTSPSMEKMHQEILAAAFLGKKVPKWKVNYKISKRGRAKKKITKTRLEGSKKTATLAAKAKFRAQLRNEQGQFASPTSLIALINKKLPKEIQDNMGLPGLEYDTGKFAQSVRVLKFQQGKNAKIPTLQYTYDTDPYQVFETGGKGDSRWATGARDPRKLIDKTIREIASEMMINRFATQRL